MWLSWVCVLATLWMECRQIWSLTHWSLSTWPKLCERYIQMHLLREKFISFKEQHFVSNLGSNHITICCRFHIYPGKFGFCPFIIVQYYGVRKWLNTLWSDGRIRTFVHYTASLSSLCGRIWKYWTSKMLVRYILHSILRYIGLWIFSLPTSLVMIVRICVYFIILSSSNWKYENHWHLFMGRSWNNGMLCMSFYVLTVLSQAIVGKGDL